MSAVWSAGGSTVALLGPLFGAGGGISTGEGVGDLLPAQSRGAGRGDSRWAFVGGSVGQLLLVLADLCPRVRAQPGVDRSTIEDCAATGVAVGQRGGHAGGEVAVLAASAGRLRGPQ